MTRLLLLSSNYIMKIYRDLILKRDSNADFTIKYSLFHDKYQANRGKYFSLCPPKLDGTVLENQGRVFFISQFLVTFLLKNEVFYSKNRSNKKLYYFWSKTPNQSTLKLENWKSQGFLSYLLSKL